MTGNGDKPGGASLETIFVAYNGNLYDSNGGPLKPHKFGYNAPLKSLYVSPTEYALRERVKVLEAELEKLRETGCFPGTYQPSENHANNLRYQGCLATGKEPK